MSTLRERVEELLASLGADADDVADSLRARGIKGNTSDGECCPISNLLSAEFPEAANGKWGNYAEGHWWVDHGLIRTPEGSVTTTGAVNEFIAVFDDGVVEFEEEDGGDRVWPYADLEATGEAG